MLSSALLNTLAKLPEPLQQEVLNYAEYLAQKYIQSQAPQEAHSKKRTAGALKGKIWMATNFDEPLEDFAEYM